jgi:protocatechuate 3,4-dioxygenase beta subunit
MKSRSKHLISRRDTLRLLGIAGASTLVGFRGERASAILPAGLANSVAKASALSCVVRPSQTEGPYFVDERLNRSDIRTDPANNSVRPGTLLTLNINVSYVNGNSCVALPGAYVDIWHCDALGSYSDVGSAVGHKYLRGYQVTDSDGAVQFKTVFPGWYTGRAVHIHFKIRLFTGSQKTYEFTSQLYFDDSFTDQVYTQSPYNTRGSRDTRNSRDGIYRNGGSQLTLTAAQSGQGYAATFDIGLEGITITPSAPPEIFNAAASGKKLMVSGQNFGSGAAILMDGEKQKTRNDETNATSLLIAKKAGKKIEAGQTVTLQVRNPDNSLSNEFSFTRSA